MSVLLYGPAMDGSGTTVNKYVPEADVPVYEAIGYRRGARPVTSQGEKGDKGEAGRGIQVFDQSDEPVTAQTGDIWITS